MKNANRLLSVVLMAALSASLCLSSFAATPWTYVNSLYDREEAGDFNGAIPDLEKIIENESYFTDPNVVSAAKAKLKHYGSEIELYTETDKSQSFSDALHEQQIGVKMGTCNNDDNLYYSDSVLFTYTLNELYFRKAKETGRDLYYAFNIVGEGTEVRNSDFTAQANELAALCKKYSDLKIFVRFGAEMNIWTDMCIPEEFIADFRNVATILKTSCDNVAMVWGINFVSHAGVNYMDYYPGDEYVDWLGMCFYAEMYQGGSKYSGEQAFLNHVMNTQYFKGNAADPVIAIREMNENFGGRKPIMISECGTLTKVPNGNMAGEDTTAFALAALRKIYEYVPMCCPEVKVIAHFNSHLPGRSNDFALKSTPAVDSLYNELSGRKHFVNLKNNQQPVAYERLENSFTVKAEKFPISAYVKNYAVYEPTVEYYIDGVAVATVDTLPYRATLDFSGLSNGAHTLRIVSVESGKLIQEKTYNFTVAIPRVGDKINSVLSTDIVAYIDGTPIKSYNIDGYTAVVAEELANYGFDVKWNGKERTLTIGSGSKNVASEYVPEKSDLKIGTPVMDVLFTDIVTYCNGNRISGFNVGGSTIVYIDDLSAFGSLKWDGVSRTISFTFNR